MYTLVTVLLVAGQFSFGSASIAGGDDLEALCGGQPVELISITQLHSLMHKLKGSSCPDHIRGALVDLSELVEQDSNNVCTINKVDAIKGYYAKYLDNSDRTLVRERKTPKSIARFAVAYAMQISSHCKIHMLGVLSDRGLDTLSSNNFDAIKDWTCEGCSVANLLDAIAKPGEIILPSDLMAVLPDETSIGRKLESTSALWNIVHAKEVCQHKFKPIYEPVVRPVAALTRAGFDLPNVLLNVHEREQIDLVKESMTMWLRVVFLCESLDLIDTENKEEAIDHLHPKAPGVGLAESKNNPKPSGGVGPLLITGYDRKLTRLLDSFSTSKTESDRIKDKLMRRSWRLLKARFRHGEYKALFKSVFIKMTPMKSSKKLELINKEIIELLEAKKETATYKTLSTAIKPVERYAQQVIGAMTVLDIIKKTGLTREEINEAKKIED